MGQGRYDAIVVGGGHNGLVAAAYLAKQGHRTLVCEAREVVEGRRRHRAAVRAGLQGDLAVVRGQPDAAGGRPRPRPAPPRLQGLPQGPYFAPPAAPRSSSQRRQAPQGRSPGSRPATPTPRSWDAWMAGLADVLGPLLSAVPPKVGSATRSTWPSRPAWSGGCAASTPARRPTSPAVHPEHRRPAGGVLRVARAPGRPRRRRRHRRLGRAAGPGTAYVMAHHHIGVGDGKLGSWGFAEGGMGGVSNAMAAAARSFGAEIRTSAPVRRITTKGRPGHRGRPRGRGGVTADLVVAPPTPGSPSWSRSTGPSRPTFVTDIERWKTRSGTVKVNLATTGCPGSPAGRVRPRDPRRHHRARRVAGRHGGRLPGRGRRPAVGAPFADVIPLGVRQDLAPEGHTSSRCSPSGCPTPGPASRWTRSWRPTPTG